MKVEVYALKEVHLLAIHNSTFDYNLAGRDGGALYIQDTTVRVTETEFSNNMANRNGGIIFLRDFKQKLTVLTVHFSPILQVAMADCFMSL